MGREKLLDGPGVLALHLLQDPEHVGEAVRVDPRGGGVAHAGVVGRALVLPAEARERGCGHDVQRLTLGRPRLSPEHDVAQPDAERRRTLLLDLPGGVAQVHVADLVAQHPGELTVAGGVLDQAARHIDVPARDRKSTRLNSSHGYISYAVFCLKKKRRTNSTSHTEKKKYSSSTLGI